MRDQKALFFLRHYNDIDHIVPVLYKWLLTENVATHVVITSKPEYIEDYRIKFLDQFDHFRVQFIDAFVPEGYKQNSEFTSGTNKAKKNLLPKLKRKILGGSTDKTAQSVYNQAFIKILLDKIFSNNDKGIVVFDWTFTDFVKLTVKEARNRNLTTISLPHGDSPHWNKLITLDELNYSYQQSYALGEIFDYMVVPNNLCARRYEPYLRSDHLKVLGSPRFNDEWLGIISKLLPAYDASESEGKLKIVFFLRNFNYPIFWEEVIRAIKLLLQFPEVFLIVQHHTRDATLRKLIGKYPELDENRSLNLRFIGGNIPATSLLKWADIVLDLGTSISFEAVKRKIPVLAMEYLYAYRTTIAHYIENSDLQCRDELFDRIKNFIKQGSQGFYDETERQQFINQMIDVPDKNVLMRYARFLSSCF